MGVEMQRGTRCCVLFLVLLSALCSARTAAYTQASNAMRQHRPGGILSLRVSVDHLPLPPLLSSRRALRETDGSSSGGIDTSNSASSSSSGSVSGGNTPGNHSSSSSSASSSSSMKQYFTFDPLAEFVSRSWEMIMGHSADTNNNTNSAVATYEHSNTPTTTTIATTAGSSATKDSSTSSSSSSSGGGNSSNNDAVIGLGVALAVVGVVAASASILVCLLCWRVKGGGGGGPSFMRLKPHAFVSPSSSSSSVVPQEEDTGGLRLPKSAASTVKIGSSRLSSRSSSFCGPINVQQVTGFSLREMKEATRNFTPANLLGHGSYGMVYKGKLKTGEVVAVKRAKHERKEGEQIGKFQSEIELLSRVSHKNLVRLVGYCQEDAEQLLVYEYVAGGNLAQNLDRGWRARHSRPPLNWTERLQMAIGTARALAYLHEEISLPFIHRDVKASNIMIDRHVTAKLADFGTSKVATQEELRKQSANIQGTAGYCDPNYLITGQVWKGIDVYSFGIVLIELITGEHPSTVSRPYRYHMKQRFDNEGLASMVDQSMGIYPEWEVSQVMDLAFRCTNTDDPTSRPPMTRVVLELEAVMEPDSLGSPYISRNLSPRGKQKDLSVRPPPEGNQGRRREDHASASTLSLYTLPSFGEMENVQVDEHRDEPANEKWGKVGSSLGVTNESMGRKASVGVEEGECYRAEVRARGIHEARGVESGDYDSSGVYSFGSLPPP